MYKFIWIGHGAGYRHPIYIRITHKRSPAIKKARHTERSACWASDNKLFLDHKTAQIDKLLNPFADLLFSKIFDFLGTEFLYTE
jgi:hypothetical protein